MFLGTRRVGRLSPIVGGLLVRESMDRITKTRGSVRDERVLTMLRLFRQRAKQRVSLPCDIATGEVCRKILLAGNSGGIASMRRGRGEGRRDSFILRLRVPKRARVPKAGLGVYYAVDNRGRGGSTGRVPRGDCAGYFSCSVVGDDLYIECEQPKSCFAVSKRKGGGGLGDCFVSRGVPRRRQSERLLVTRKDRVM